MPPSAQHADQAEPRSHVPDAAAALSEVGVRDLHEAVPAGLEQHPLEQHPALLLAVDAHPELLARVRELRREAIAQLLELAELEHAWAGQPPRLEHHADALAR